jgi:hypothetical protein
MEGLGGVPVMVGVAVYVGVGVLVGVAVRDPVGVNVFETAAPLTVPPSMFDPLVSKLFISIAFTK